MLTYKFVGKSHDRGFVMRHDDSTVRVSTFVMEVWGEEYEVRVRQKSKSVWIASGEYMGEHLVSEGSTARSAAAHWREAARYKGNDGPPPPASTGRA